MINYYNIYTFYVPNKNNYKNEDIQREKPDILRLSFLALSEELSIPFITADEKLYKSAKDNDYNVILLSNFDKNYV